MQQNRFLKSFFREHKLSRISVFRIFKSINFPEKGQNSRKSRKFLLAKVCTLKAIFFYYLYLQWLQMLKIFVFIYITFIALTRIRYFYKSFVFQCLFGIDKNSGKEILILQFNNRRFHFKLFYQLESFQYRQIRSQRPSVCTSSN